MFPPNGSATRRPLPSVGSLRVRFPDLVGTMRRSDSLRTVSPRLVVLRLAIPPRASVFVSPTRPDAGLGPGAFGLAAPRPDFVEVEPQGVPSSWGTLVCLCRVLR